jgi:hypothetical protein
MITAPGYDIYCNVNYFLHVTCSAVLLRTGMSRAKYSTKAQNVLICVIKHEKDMLRQVTMPLVY